MTSQHSPIRLLTNSATRCHKSCKHKMHWLVCLLHATALVTKNIRHGLSWVWSELLVVLHVKITVCCNIAPRTFFDYPEDWGKSLPKPRSRKKKNRGVTSQYCNLQTVLCSEFWGGLGGGVERDLSHIIYNKSTRCNSGSILFINNYKYALHVSDALCVHHQEHYKL